MREMAILVLLKLNIGMVKVNIEQVMTTVMNLIKKKYVL